MPNVVAVTQTKGASHTLVPDLISIQPDDSVAAGRKLRKEFNTILRCGQTPLWPVSDLGSPVCLTLPTLENAASTLRSPQLSDSASSTAPNQPPSTDGDFGEPRSESPCTRTSGCATDDDEKPSRLENPKERSRRAAANRTQREYVERRFKRVKALIGRTVSNMEFTQRPQLKQEFDPQSWHNALISAKRLWTRRPFKTEELPSFHDINGHILTSRASYIALTLRYEPIWTRFQEQHYIVSRTGIRKMRPGNGLLLKLAKFAIPWYTEGIQTAVRNEEKRKELLSHKSESIKQILSLDPKPKFWRHSRKRASSGTWTSTRCPTQDMIGDLLISPRPKVYFSGTDTIDRRTNTLFGANHARLS